MRSGVKRQNNPSSIQIRVVPGGFPIFVYALLQYRIPCKSLQENDINGRTPAMILRHIFSFRIQVAVCLTSYEFRFCDAAPVPACCYMFVAS